MRTHRKISLDATGAFPHSGQSPVSRPAALFENGRIDASAIVAEAESQFTPCVRYSNLDVLRAGVLAGIDQSLTTDPEKFIAHDGVQWFGDAFDDHAELRRVRQLQFFADTAECLGQILIAGR